MAQGALQLPVTGVFGGGTEQGYINVALAALASSNSGASAPSAAGSPVKGELWLNTALTPNLLSIYDGADWLPVCFIDATNHYGTDFVTGPIAGCTISEPSNTTVSFAAGKIGEFPMPALTKVLQSSGAWSAGASGNGLFTGAIGASAGYYAFGMFNLTSFAMDYGLDTSATGSNAPAGWLVSYLGWVVTDGSSHLRPTLRSGDLVRLVTPILDLNTTALVQGAWTDLTVTAPPNKLVSAFGTFWSGNTSAGSDGGLNIRPKGAADPVPTSRGIGPTLSTPVSGSSEQQAGYWECLLDANAKLQYVQNGGGSAGSLIIWTTGWRDPRGRS